MKAKFLGEGQESRNTMDQLGGLHIGAQGNFKAFVPVTAGPVTPFLILSQFCSWKVFSGLFYVHMVWRTRLTQAV